VGSTESGGPVATGPGDMTDPGDGLPLVPTGSGVEPGTALELGGELAVGPTLGGGADEQPTTTTTNNALTDDRHDIERPTSSHSRRAPRGR
jgi:hypothetical protein